MSEPRMILLAALLPLVAGCARTAPVVEGAWPTDRVVLVGEVEGDEPLVLRGADGRRYRVDPRPGRFVVAVPAGVYDVGDKTLSGVPGDVLYIGSVRADGHRVVARDEWNALDRTDLPATIRPRVLTPTPVPASLYAGEAHGRTAETPGRYQARTGRPARAIPGPGRAGQGLGLRGR